MHIDFEAFLHSLDYMWKGMLGIFIVIIVIFLVVKLLGILFPEKPDQDTND